MTSAHMFFDGIGMGLAEALWSLLVLGFWIAVIVLVVRLVRRSPAHAPPPQSSALAVLEERYARGEISREEFAERRAVLRGES